MKWLVIHSLLVPITAFAQTIELTLDNGYSHTGTVVNCGDEKVLFKSDQLNKRLSVGYENIRGVKLGEISFEAPLGSWLCDSVQNLLRAEQLEREKENEDTAEEEKSAKAESRDSVDAEDVAPKTMEQRITELEGRVDSLQVEVKSTSRAGRYQERDASISGAHIAAGLGLIAWGVYDIIERSVGLTYVDDPGSVPGIYRIGFAVDVGLIILGITSIANAKE